MAEADFARASIVKSQAGFSVAVVLKCGEQIDAWNDSFESLEEATASHAQPATCRPGS
jgi:hypothetical protein